MAEDKPKLYIYQQRKCPLSHADYCIGGADGKPGCAIFDDVDGCCSILSIARALRARVDKPKKGGR